MAALRAPLQTGLAFAVSTGCSLPHFPALVPDCGQRPSTVSSWRNAPPGAHRGAAGFRCMAKAAKGGKGAKTAQKKGSLIPKPGQAGADAGDGTPPSTNPYTQGEIIMHSLEVIDSYFRAVGSPIFAEPVEVVNAAKALWDADFALVTHGTEEDPIFNYGNARALELFDTGWPEFTAMASRRSVQDGMAPDRESLLESAKAGAKDLKGIVRQTTKGRLFEVDEGVIWTLVASDGETFGQAAVFRQWHFLDEKEAEEESGTAERSASSELTEDPVPSPAEVSPTTA